MGQPNNRQKALFVIAGTLSLIAGIVGIIIVVKVVFETGDFFGLVSDQFIGVASIPVLIGNGVFILSKAMKSSRQMIDTKLRE